MYVHKFFLVGLCMTRRIWTVLRFLSPPPVLWWLPLLSRSSWVIYLLSHFRPLLARRCSTKHQTTILRQIYCTLPLFQTPVFPQQLTILGPFSESVELEDKKDTPSTMTPSTARARTKNVTFNPFHKKEGRHRATPRVSLSSHPKNNILRSIYNSRLHTGRRSIKPDEVHDAFLLFEAESTTCIFFPGGRLDSLYVTSTHDEMKGCGRCPKNMKKGFC